MSNSVTLPDHDAKPTATLSDRSSDTPYRCLLRAFAAYTLGVVLSVSILALFLRPWAVPLRTPVAYDWGDGKCVLALIQGILENGWYLHNDRLGAPFGLDMRGFPMVTACISGSSSSCRW